MLKGVFITLFLAATWAGVAYFELPYYYAGIVTALTAMVISTVLGIRFARSRKASKEIERALRAQAEDQARSARPDLEADIRSMQEEFARAIGALKSSRLGARGASSALYSLPWYVIVGPPGVGKSTALRNSGLKFPFSSNRGGVSVQGVGGTRNCEWWMTSEAVILDTAGRYTTENTDRDEWFAFLDLLRKYRTRRPINGVLAAVSVADIAEAHPEEIATLAREIRARIDELQDRLGVVVPVYMLFTKCDLLPGFVEMFSDLNEAERHQMWGFTLKVSDQLSIADQCSEHLDELSSLLEKRTLRRLAEERSMARRERLHELPQYFASLREPIARFMHEMTEPNIYHETPILRGVYMTSGTQEGRPLGRIMSAISEAFGLRPTIGGATVAPVDAKSYFLGEIFRKVIFPDYSLVRHNRRRTRKLRIGGTVAGAVALVAAIATVILPLMSYRHNRDILGQGGSSLAYVEQHLAEDSGDVIPMERIEPLRRMVDMLQTYEEDGAPWSMRMGMYQGGRMYPRMRDVFIDTVRRELHVPVAGRELEALDRFVQRYKMNDKTPSLEEYEDNFTRLRMYLLTSGPAEASEAGLNEEESAWLTDHLGNLWEAPILLSGEPTSRDSIDKVASTYLRLLALRPDLAFPRDTDIVQLARDILSRVDRTEAITNHLVDSVTGPALTLNSMFQVPAVTNDGKKIRPAFTKKGFDTQVKPLFEEGIEAFLDPTWVLAQAGGVAEELEEQEVIAIQSAYYRLYIDEWRTFIEAVNVQTPGGKNYTDTLELLRDLTRKDPYPRLFQFVAHHTTLFDPAKLAAGGLAGGGNDPLKNALSQAGKRVGNRFAQKGLMKTGAGKVGVSTSLVNVAAGQALANEKLADPNEVNVVSEFTVHLHFKPLTDFGVAEPLPPVVDGAPPPPPTVKPLDEYQEQLRYVRDAMEAELSDPDSKDNTTEKIKKARSKTKSLLSAETSNVWAPTLERLLLPPIELSGATAVTKAADGVMSKWCSEVEAEFGDTLLQGYPFNAKGPPVALDDLTDFYHPKTGSLWDFYDKVLEPSIPRRGKKFVLAPRGSSGNTFHGRTVDFLNASEQISKSMFPRGSDEPLVEFEVTIKGSPAMTKALFTIDGETVTYRTGPLTPYAMKWPGEKSPGATLEVHGFSTKDSLEFPGEWGLMQLLEQGKVVRGKPGTRKFKAVWDFSDAKLGTLEIIFEARSVHTPFFGLGGTSKFMSIFRTGAVRPPRSIVARGRPCQR
ncbi:MAG: type VI secretion system membrane subunit TssM [Nannocystaceae bacterium]|nr:type VI secretion system membrane subunit TssM [Nannocystaceae bacterium]